MGKSIKIFAAVIITAAVVLAINSFWGDSVIIDEVPHIGAGYSYLVKQDMRLNPEHPPLVKDLSAIPLLFTDINQDVFQTRFWQADINGQWEFGRFFLFNSGNDADLVKNLAKLPVLILFILSAILVFKWSRKLYGDRGGIIALILFSFSPTVLAHARLVTTDIAALFGVLIATYYFIDYLKAPNRKNFIIASLIFGLALLTKFSTFLLVPFFGLLALIYGFMNTSHGFWNKTWGAVRTAILTVLIFAVGFVAVVWPIYYFHTYNYPAEKQHSDTSSILASYGNRLFADPVVWASDKPIIRAAGQYGLGLLMVTQRSVGGNTVYFLGDVERFGWRHYFPVVYFIKESLAWWGFVLIALLMLGWQMRRPSRESFRRGRDFVKKHFTEFAMLLWLLIYWSISIRSTLNIGVRHLLPIFPFTIILVSGQISRLSETARAKSKKAFTAFIITISALTGWYVYETVSVHPFYLSYFNQTVGGPSGGYRFVVDSNLDWGQDLVRFSNWVKENNIPKIEFDYFGWADPQYYMGSTYERLWASKYRDAQDFVANNQTDGWLAVSATFLQGSQGPEDIPNEINYLWLKSYEPLGTIGNSIFIYRIK